ncbi:S-layer homology domain-containing protein [Brevibacillus daliensis]|uniref:S-layer homology domain-containing protein n=1 Tax=Brevibacillus daliensis TaxID=2892995 RepID=UPI001E28DDF3|nr:S-layer homology domain-containing protein [Brevibacillus daliensis]
MKKGLRSSLTALTAVATVLSGSGFIPYVGIENNVAHASENVTPVVTEDVVKSNSNAVDTKKEEVQAETTQISQPTNLKVTGTTSNSITLNWDKVEAAKKYKLSVGSETIFVDNTQSTPTVTVEKLKGETTYVVTLVAIGADGVTESAPTTTNATTLADSVPNPNEVAPAQPANFKASKVQSSSIVLQWSEVKGADEYILKRDDNVLIAKTKSTVVKDDTVTPNKLHKYYVVAKNKYGESAPVEYVVKTPPVTKVEKSNVDSTHNKVSFNFKQVEGATGYVVTRNSEWIYTPNGDGTFSLKVVNKTGTSTNLGKVTPKNGMLEFTESDLDSNKKYSYELIAYLPSGPNGEVVSTDPTTVDAKTAEKPPKKKDIVADSIQVSEGKLDPKFKKDKYKYDVEVPYGEKTIKVKVTVDTDDYKDFTIKVDGEKAKNERYSDEIKLKEGNNKIKVIIKDKDGEETEYVINVYRKKKDDSNSNNSNGSSSSSNNSSSTNGTSGSKVSGFTTKPSVDNLKPNELLGRSNGHIAFPESVQAKAGISTVSINVYDTAKINKAKAEGKQLKMYYYNSRSKQWVALSSQATIEADRAQVNAQPINGMNTWYAVFAVNQPKYVDIANHWAMNSIERLTGIGVFEGYNGNKGTIFKPNNAISKAELSSTLARILGVSANANDYTLYNVVSKLNVTEEQSIISSMQGVPDWAKSYVAPLKKSNIIPNHLSVNFNGNQAVTRAEAGVFITNALKATPGYFVQPLNVRTYKDGSTVPDWAVDKIDYRIMKGDQSNNLNPNKPLTRAELAVMIDRTIQTLGW